MAWIQVRSAHTQIVHLLRRNSLFPLNLPIPWHSAFSNSTQRRHGNRKIKEKNIQRDEMWVNGEINGKNARSPRNSLIIFFFVAPYFIFPHCALPFNRPSSHSFPHFICVGWLLFHHLSFVLCAICVRYFSRLYSFIHSAIFFI